MTITEYTHIATKDGLTKALGSHNACFERIQHSQSQSVDWATKHEGWAIQEMRTRNDYLEKESVSHEDYYGQFATKTVLALVLSRFSRSQIENGDANFNNVGSLRDWDHMAGGLPRDVLEALSYSNWSTMGPSDRKYGRPRYSLHELVCVLKAAARAIKEGAQA
tara:strand:+ start:1045 stop:1536 length:492 start_codon:yes stop_codon:yes gene_type:complete